MKLTHFLTLGSVSTPILMAFKVVRISSCKKWVKTIVQPISILAFRSKDGRAINERKITTEKDIVSLLSFQGVFNEITETLPAPDSRFIRAKSVKQRRYCTKKIAYTWIISWLNDKASPCDYRYDYDNAHFNTTLFCRVLCSLVRECTPLLRFTPRQRQK